MTISCRPAHGIAPNGPLTMISPRPWLASVVFATVANAQTARKPPVFDTDIKPLFAAKCGACHGGTAQGKLDLRTSEGILKGGASGPSVVPGEAAKSLLMDKIVTGQMPPGKGK